MQKESRLQKDEHSPMEEIMCDSLSAIFYRDSLSAIFYRDSLPAIIYEDFTEEVLAEILKIYARVAKIKNPCNTTFDIQHDFPIIYAAMCDRQVCEFRFGSNITRHSKLIFYPVFKREGQHIAFDFDPNTSDDSMKKPVAMREKFHKEVEKYLFTLPQSID